MKKSVILATFFFFIIPFKTGAGLESAYVLDSIDAVIYTQDGSDLITKSDVARPGLSGVSRTREDIIFDRLVVLDAKKHKVMPSDDEVDRYLASVQRDNNLSRDDLAMIFQTSGYSFKEGREQFRIMQTVNMMLDFKVRSGLVIPRKFVDAYYNEHPRVEEASYYLEHAIIAFDSAMSADEQERKIKAYIGLGEAIPSARWSKPFWIASSDLAADKNFIHTLQSGHVSKPQRVNNGFELYRMVERKEERTATLNERYREITDILRKPRFDELMSAYREALFANASIVMY